MTINDWNRNFEPVQQVIPGGQIYYRLLNPKYFNYDENVQYIKTETERVEREVGITIRLPECCS